jgi:arginase family enzyme
MARDLIQHVVEEPDAGVKAPLAAAIQIDAHGDLRFSRMADNLGMPLVVR